MKAVRDYRDCVIKAAQRPVSSNSQDADPGLLALYSCPAKRADAQALLTWIYGLTVTQTLFKAVDQRILREARAVSATTRVSARQR
jgi:hypothetical protein